jgi:hypothetical protein
MRPSKPLLSLAVTCTSLALLAGCGGGGGDSSSTAATSTAEGSTPTPPTSAKAEQDNVPKKSNPVKATSPNGGSEAAKGSKPAKPSSDPAPTDPKPLPNEGTDAVAAGVPTVKVGDNSIQEYGLEAPSAERIEVASIAQAYLQAQAAGDWDVACSHLAAPVHKKLVLLGKSAPSPVGCEGAMEALLSRKPKAELQSAAEIEVLSLRVKGSQAFVIYRDGNGEPFNLPLIDEGEWKISAPVGIGLVL